MIDNIKFEEMCRQVNEQHAFLQQLQKDIKQLSVSLAIFVKRQSTANCDHLTLEKKAARSTTVNSTASPGVTQKLSWHKCVDCGVEIQIVKVVEKVVR